MHREARIISGVLAISIVIGMSLFYLPNWFLDSQFVSDTVPFTKITQGSRSEIETRVNYLIKSPEELNDLWTLIGEASAPPLVDFKTHSVIALFAGKQPTAGYEISVAKIKDTDVRNVVIKITTPDQSCTTASIETTPYEIAIVPATPLQFTHEDISTTKTCTK